MEALKAAVSDHWFDCIETVCFSGGWAMLHPELVDVFKSTLLRWPVGRLIIDCNGQEDGVLGKLSGLIDVHPRFVLRVDVQGDPEPLYGLLDLAKRRMVGTAERRPIILRAEVSGSTLEAFAKLRQIARANNAELEIHPSLGPGSWTTDAVQKFGSIIESIPDSDFSQPGYHHAIAGFLMSGKALQCQAPMRAIRVSPDLRVRYCLQLEPVCDLVDYPSFYAAAWEWIEASEAAAGAECFVAACLNDQSHHMSYGRVGRRGEPFLADPTPIRPRPVEPDVREEAL